MRTHRAAKRAESRSLVPRRHEMERQLAPARIWHLTYLLSAEAYCGATPTEALPFLGSEVSSTTITAFSPLPPSSTSALRASSSRSGDASQVPAETKW
jgi:hypothetical protein